MQKQGRAKFVLGITGNIACGKSTVSKMFKTRDSLLIDADVIARMFLAKNRRIYEKVKAAFGEGILKPNKRIDRKKLGRIVFADSSALNRLNKIIHPALIKEIKRLIKKSDKKIIVLDAALIIEAGLRKIVDKLVVVTTQRQQQIQRLMQRGVFRKEDIVMRMKSQISQKEKLRFADFIIDNSGQIRKTEKQVSEIRRKLWKS